MEICQQSGDKQGEGRTLNNIGQICQAKKHYKTALTYYQQSLNIFQQIGDKQDEGSSLNNIGQIYRVQGDYETALRYLEQSLGICQQIGDRAAVAGIWHNIGTIYFSQIQDFELALPFLLRAYSIFKEIGSPTADITFKYLRDILEQIGEERFNQIIQSIQAD